MISSVAAVVPAAGVGKRMKAAIPKQYLPLVGKTVLEHTLTRLDEMPFVSCIVISLGEQDEWWSGLELKLSKPLYRVNGGAERVHSVANAVENVVSESRSDWILVHDAARPCVQQKDVERLLLEASGHTCGGILGVPVRDTMKQMNADGEIDRTLDRSKMWHALTPQLFKSELLHQALQSGLQYPEQITDEASALEAMGYHPLLVEGSADNLKITRPEDLALAEFYLKHFSKDT